MISMYVPDKPAFLGPRGLLRWRCVETVEVCWSLYQSFALVSRRLFFCLPAQLNNPLILTIQSLFEDGILQPVDWFVVLNLNLSVIFPCVSDSAA